MSDKAPKVRRSISKAKLYVVIKESLVEYGLGGGSQVDELLDALKESIVIEATK